MKWIDVWKIVICAIGSAGGVGAIIVVAIRFSVNMIADRLSKKYESKLQKELEEYKSILEGKNYISKVQFDMEFEIYKNISGALFDTVRTMNSAFSPDYYVESQPNKIDSAIDSLVSIANNLQSAQDELHGKSAFIPAELFEKYNEIIVEAQDLFWEYSEMIKKEKMQQDKRTVEWVKEKYKQTEIIDEKRKQINDELRIYLRNIVIV